MVEKREQASKNTLQASTSRSTQRYFQSDGKNYAHYRPTYPPELAKALASSCKSRRLAVDVGCGSGQLSVLLAEYFDHVVASDVSADQLAHAVGRPNVSYLCGAAEAMSAGTNSADLIVAAQAAHWFDLSLFYREVRRVARSGAALALISYGVPCLKDPANVKLQQFYWQQLKPFWPPERHHVETGYAELPFPFEELATPQLSIHRDWDINNLMEYLKTWTATRRAITGGHRAILRQFRDELVALWGESTSRKRVIWPIAIRLGRIQKSRSN